MKRSGMIVSTNLMLALFGALVLCGTQSLPLGDVLIEVFSAIGTVGMSTGITRELTTLSALVVALLMYCGRVGSVSFAMALLERRTDPPGDLSRGTGHSRLTGGHKTMKSFLIIGMGTFATTSAARSAS